MSKIAWAVLGIDALLVVVGLGIALAVVAGGGAPPQTLYGRPVLPETPGTVGTCALCGHKMAIPLAYTRLNDMAKLTRELTCPECGDREPVTIWETNPNRR